MMIATMERKVVQKHRDMSYEVEEMKKTEQQ